ncbi:hypothetical protein Slala05_67160 [Streptomyces lavendulae subsp. lavendulae]|nr:hypothetical protein Slala05_67160 [Streptomyces lavendulae subsp. lavendulae]
MSSPAVTVHPDATIAGAARIMATKNVKRLPVVNGIGLLEGAVSHGDLLKVFLRPDEEIEAEIRDDVLAELAPPVHIGCSVEESVATMWPPCEATSTTPPWYLSSRAPSAPSKGSWTCGWSSQEPRRPRERLASSGLPPVLQDHASGSRIRRS